MREKDVGTGMPKFSAIREKPEGGLKRPPPPPGRGLNSYPMTLRIKTIPNSTYSMHHICIILGQNRDLYMLMDNGLDMGNIFPEKRLGFGFGFPVMGRAGFGPQILTHEGLYPKWLYFAGGLPLNTSEIERWRIQPISK